MPPFNVDIFAIVEFDRGSLAVQASTERTREREGRKSERDREKEGEMGEREGYTR